MCVCVCVCAHARVCVCECCLYLCVYVCTWFLLIYVTIHINKYIHAFLDIIKWICPHLRDLFSLIFLLLSSTVTAWTWPTSGYLCLIILERETLFGFEPHSQSLPVSFYVRWSDRLREGFPAKSKDARIKTNASKPLFSARQRHWFLPSQLPCDY